ncbi:MAG: hypothetical protein II619_05250, partial [Bacilli bacterium]|nr:hypothetical protein [Bacilli bacterium]
LVGVALVSACTAGAVNSSVPSSIVYEGESVFRVYEVTKDWYTGEVTSARFDIEFKSKNGEPIADKKRGDELRFKLNPDLSKLTGDGYYYIHFFYYDLECTKFVKFDDVATCDLNLFYYVTG